MRLALGICLAVGVLTSAQPPLQSHPPRSRQESDAALVAEARQRPDTIRKELTLAFSQAASAVTPVERAACLSRAHRLGNAYARAWHDSFLVRQVSWFEGLTPAQQKSHVIADSLRLAGNIAMGAEGVPAAMLLWRQSVRHATALGDSAVLAPAILSVGAGFYRLGQSDSAMNYVARARDLATRDGDHRTRGNAIGIAASLNKDRGDFSKAAELYRSASTVRALSGDSRGIAADQNNLGLIAQEVGDLPATSRAFEKAMNINQRDGRRSLVALNLGNLAGIAANSGDYLHADSLYKQALTIERATGDRAETGFVLQSLGRLQIRRGDYGQAQLTLSEALEIHQKSGATVDAIAVRTDLASLQSAVGDPEGAMETLRVNDREADSASAPPELRAGLALARGDLALQFGTFTEANSQYTRAEQLYATAGNAAGRAQAQQGRALLLHLRGDDQAASRLISDVVRVQLAAGDRRSAALSQFLLAQLQHARGDTAAARQTLVRSVDMLHRLGDAVGEAAALASLGDLGVHDGANRAAERLYRRGLDRLGSRPANEVRWRLHAGLGEALRGRGALAAAATEFRVAIGLAEQTAAGFQLDERKSGFLSDKWNVYSELALLEQGLGHAGEAFAVSERIRARQMLDLLARSRTPVARLVSGETFSWKAVASHLRPDEVLLEYLLTDSASTVFVVTADTVAALDLHLTREALADLVEFSRRAMQKPNVSGAIPIWRSPLRRLYAELIQPVEERGFLRGKRTLVIVPHQELHFLSFASLISPGAPDHYLIERFQIAYSPSAATWVQLGVRGGPSTNRNVLAFAPHVDQLPASGGEVQAIGRIYGARATVRTGAAASGRAFRAALRNAGTLHLATFGVLNNHNPLLSFVELAPEGKDNGHLDVNQVLSLGLSGQLVVLSACQTALASGGAADVPSGDDWVGLMQAFLQGGASSVVASLWPVDDRATAQLMEYFHQRRSAGVAVVGALADAQRALIRDRRTSAPSYWAGFVANGGSNNP
jgi:CHAT domain-containing protein